MNIIKKYPYFGFGANNIVSGELIERVKLFELALKLSDEVN